MVDMPVDPGNAFLMTLDRFESRNFQEEVEDKVLEIEK